VFDLLGAVWRMLPGQVRGAVLVRTQPRFLVGTLGLIADGDGRILLLEHRFRPHPWGLPGGFMKHGELPAQALAREIREETGLAIVVEERALDTEFVVRSGYSYVRFLFAARASNAPLRLSREIKSGRFMAPGEIPAETDPKHLWLIRRHGQR
jgi:ADP-ribose pyrophosphatase YjhB (NUDIX family)